MPHLALRGPCFAINTAELLQAGQFQHNYFAEDRVREPPPHFCVYGTSAPPSSLTRTMYGISAFADAPSRRTQSSAAAPRSLAVEFVAQCQLEYQSDDLITGSLDFGNIFADYHIQVQR